MVYQKIVKIMGELVPIGKIKREEIVTVMQPLLVKHNLVVRPATVSDYKFINQEANFITKYEVVDAESGNHPAITLEVPGGRS